MRTLKNIESFMRLLHAVQNVERVARIPDEKKYRNTAEHTFELTLLCWYLASGEETTLDIEKVLMYALSHDLIEAYAGDSYIYDIDAQKTKKEREAKALVRIEETFAEFPELIETIHAYEARADEESKFVYATDKIIDPLNISMETTQSLWKEHNITYDAIREYKDAKVATSNRILPYWKEIMEKVSLKKDFFFEEKSE